MLNYIFAVILHRPIIRDCTVSRINRMPHDQIRRMVRSLYFIAVLGVANIHCVYAQEAPKVTAGQAGESGLNQHKNKIDAKVLDRVRSKGVAPVMVDLNVPVKSEIRTREEEQSQVRAVRAVQDLVLQELVGTQYKLRYRFDLSPTMSMEVGGDALAVLERSAYVVRVSEIGRGTNPRESIIIPEKQ